MLPPLRPSKGQYYLFEVEANSRSLPLDALLEVFDAKGRKLVELDDTVSTQDPRIYFQAPADGQFVCFQSATCTADAQGTNSSITCGPSEPSGPDFELQGEFYYAHACASGTRTIWFAKINRLNGFTGPVELDVTGLPPGVSFTPATVPAKMDYCAVILSASKDAKVGAALGAASLAGPRFQDSTASQER